MSLLSFTLFKPPVARFRSALPTLVIRCAARFSANALLFPLTDPASYKLAPATGIFLLWLRWRATLFSLNMPLIGSRYPFLLQAVSAAPPLNAWHHSLILKCPT